MSNQCAVPACETPTQQLKSWQRYATEAERQALIEAGEPIGPGDPVLLPVIACENHAITADLRTGTHQATCTAPPTCNCTPDYLPAD